MSNFGDEDRSQSSVVGAMPGPNDAGSADLDTLLAEVERDPGSAAFPTLAEAFRRSGRVRRAREIAEAGLEGAPSRLAGRVALALALLDLGDHEAASRALEVILQDVPEVADDYEARDATAASRDVSAEPESELDRPSWATPLAEPSSTPLSMMPREVSNDLRNDEIDDAFASAEPDPDGMLDAEPIRIDSDDPASAERLAPETDDGALALDAGRPRVFETETMASLLEVQGDRDGAEEIRAQLHSRDDGDAAEAAPYAFEDAALDAAEPCVDAASAPPPADASPDPSDRTRILATLDSWLGNIRREVV